MVARAVLPKQSGFTGTSPAQDREPLLGHDLVDSRSHLCGQRFSGWQETNSRSVGTFSWQREVDYVAQQSVGHLDEDSRTVTGVGFGARGTTVFEVRQRQQAGLHQLVRANTFHVDDERHATGVMFETRVVQPGCGWREDSGYVRLSRRHHDHFHESRGFGLWRSGRHWPEEKPHHTGSSPEEGKQIRPGQVVTPPRPWSSCSSVASRNAHSGGNVP